MQNRRRLHLDPQHSIRCKDGRGPRFLAERGQSGGGGLEEGCRADSHGVAHAVAVSQRDMAALHGHRATLPYSPLFRLASFPNRVERTAFAVRRGVDDRLRPDAVAALGVQRDAHVLPRRRHAGVPADEHEIVDAVEADARHPGEGPVDASRCDPIGSGRRLSFASGSRSEKTPPRHTKPSPAD
jgi:hypothetical protein